MTYHVLSLLVEDKPGLLTRVAGLFARRGFNISSLAVGTTEVEGLSRITVVVQVSGLPLEQITKQLNKLVDVVKLQDLTEGAHIEREMMLVKARAVTADREENKRLRLAAKAAREERMMAAARSEAATRIQSLVRGWLARLQIRRLVREECDAVFPALSEGEEPRPKPCMAARRFLYIKGQRAWCLVSTLAVSALAPHMTDSEINQIPKKCILNAVISICIL